MSRRERNTTRPWLVAWLGGAGIGVANGVIREAIYKDIGDAKARRVSTATLIAVLGAYFWFSSGAGRRARKSTPSRSVPSGSR
jgi:hypothetical protein